MQDHRLDRRRNSKLIMGQYNTREKGNRPLAYCLGPTWVSLHIDLMKASPPGSTRTRPPDLTRTTSNAGPNFAYAEGKAQVQGESDRLRVRVTGYGLHSP